jgi:hypothetical protein
MEYQAVLTAEQRAWGSNLILDDLEMTMNQHWRQIGDTTKNAGDSGGKDEIVLSAVNKIIYFKCGGEEGHKASNCPNNGKRTNKHKGNNKKDKRKCFTCRQEGHIAKDCWHAEKNKDKRLRNWKPRSLREGNKIANTTVDSGNKVEFSKRVHCGYWCDSTFNALRRMGIVETRMALDSDKVTMGTMPQMLAQCRSPSFTEWYSTKTEMNWTVQSSTRSVTCQMPSLICSACLA